MTQEELRSEYFDWMCKAIETDRYFNRLGYSKLFSYLFETPFTYTIGMDGNRAADGVNLRYRFGRENGYRDPIIASLLDTEPCSVLEMMIALAIRIEEHFMEDSNIGDRTGQWFWDMIDSLGLMQMRDSRFNIRQVEQIVQRFLDRAYWPDGKGGLFTVEGFSRDMRTIEIWYQMCAYLNTIL